MIFRVWFDTKLTSCLKSLLVKTRKFAGRTSHILCTWQVDREAIQHMIGAKELCCTHFIIGRDMAEFENAVLDDIRNVKDFYGAYECQDLAKETRLNLE